MRQKPGLGKAFTLIELLVVVAIIGTLMTVGVFSYTSLAKRSRDNIRKSDLSRISNALQQHYLDLRSYPPFDATNSGGKLGKPLYSAAWQLTGSTTCTHITSDFLPPKYMTAIPEDPLQRTNLLTASCGTLGVNQTNRYVYITTTNGLAPVASPTIFGLMATLESPTAGETVSAADNPLVSGNTSTIFGPWYQKFANYGGDNTINLTVNYLVTGQNGR